jgi:PPOX class probable F420-dependent enzyme
MDLDVRRLAAQDTVLLTTFKKDGTPVGTTVSIVEDHGRLYFRTFDKAGKARRLRNNPEVVVAPSTFLGKPSGAAVHGRARLLTEEEARPVRRLLARRFPLLQGALVPLAHRLKRYRTLHYELLIDPS